MGWTKVVSESSADNIAQNAATATLATTVTITDNESTDETNAIIFTAGGVQTGGNLGLESDGNLTYNPSTGGLAATLFTGAVTGDLTGDVTQAAQTTITSLGTLTALTVDDIAIDGKVVTMTGSTDDTATVTVGTNGTLAITTVDTAASAANMTLTADGTFEAVGTTITLDSGGAINLEPASGSAILLDSTISVDAGVVTGATSITSTAFVGDITGDLTGSASAVADDMALGGIPTAATAVTGTDTTQLATTAFAVAQAKLGDTTLASAKIWIGSALGAKTELSLSGDVTMANTGVVTIGDEKIDSDHYVDGSIDNAHLADDAVDSDELAGGAVDTEHIADDQVTYAKIQNMVKDERLLGNIAGDNSVITELDQAAVLSFLGIDASSADDQTADEIGTLFAADDTTVTFGGDITVSGNLNVTGHMNEVSTESLMISDNIMVLNSDATGGSDIDAGLLVERGDTAETDYLNNKSLYWDEGNDKWQFGTSTSVAVGGTYAGDVASMDVNASYQSGSTVVPIGHFQYDTNSSTLYVRTS